MEAIRDCEYLATKGPELPYNAKAGSALCGAAISSSSSIATADSAVLVVCEKIQIQIGLVHFKCHLLSRGIKVEGIEYLSERERPRLACRTAASTLQNVSRSHCSCR